MKSIRFVAPALVCGALFVSANVFAAGEYRDRDQRQNQTDVQERGGTYGHPYGSERPRYPDREGSDRQYPDRSGPAGTDGEIDGSGTGGRGTGTGSGTGTTGGSGSGSGMGGGSGGSSGGGY